MTKCKQKQAGCEGSYVKWSITQKTCHNPACALSLVAKDKEAKARKAHKVAKLKAKTRSEWLRDAQAVFNAYIRKRDDHLPCISCSRHHTGQYHCGHYLSVGAHPELRFNEDNCSKQCRPCNEFLSGNIVRYRQNLITKIGLDKVEWLEGKHEPAKWTIEQIQGIIAEYKNKISGLKMLWISQMGFMVTIPMNRYL